MKIWKRLAALAIALTMSASLFVSAACVSDEGNGGSGQGNESTSGGNESGSGQGGGNTPGTGGGGTTPGTGSGGNTIVTPIVTALEGQTLETVNIDLRALNEENEVSQSIATGEYYSCETKQSANLSAKVNLADGDMDILTITNSEYITKDSDDATEGDKFVSTLDIYAFVRNWQVFTYNADEEDEVDDWSEVALYYEGNFNDYYEELIDDYVSDEFEDLLPSITMDDAVGIVGYLPQVNILLLNLAAAADAVTVESGKAVIDLNKLAYNLVYELNGVLNKVSDETTASEFLRNETIAKYLSSIVNIISAKELEELISAYFADSPYGEMIDYIFEQITPTGSSSTYDYLVKIVESAELLIYLGNLGIFEGFEIPETGFGNLTVGDIIKVVCNLLGYSFPEEEVNDYL